MSSRNHSNGGFRPLMALGGALVICIVAAILVTSGAWDKVAGAIPFLNQTGTSTSALMPSEEAKKKIGLHAEIPSLPTPVETTPNVQQQATESDESTTQQHNASATWPDAASTPISYATALQYAKNLAVATPHTSGYNRESQFGGWANSDQLCGSGTTRDYILKRDLTDVVMNDKCQVTSGTFHDPYTGKTMSFKRGKDSSSEIQIDHVVALNDAYASGLYRADQATRVKYANDPDVLLASEGAANNTKSAGINLRSAGKARSQWEDSTPSVWLPSNTDYQCDYMAKRVYIKHKYQLTMSQWEKTETVDFLTQCAAQ